jgi:hypothetical protein
LCATIGFVVLVFAGYQAYRFLVRNRLWREITPTHLTNCKAKRFGTENDGGYVMCANLMKEGSGLYSYGIDARDEWGCQLSQSLKAPVHQYDCFNLNRPPCGGGQPVFHEECVGEKRQTIEGRVFDSVEAQIRANGDSGKPIILKMDVEGAEWTSLSALPDETLARIDQLLVEFHGTEVPQALPLFRKLKRHFHIANVHFNNSTCVSHREVWDPIIPFPADVFEVLFVNKALTTASPKPEAAALNMYDHPNMPHARDCQAAW